MSRVEKIDVAALRARLLLAIVGDELQASPFLMAIGALLLAAEPESPFEQGLWSSLFELQAGEEGVNAAETLALLTSVAEVSP